MCPLKETKSCKTHAPSQMNDNMGYNLKTSVLRYLCCDEWAASIDSGGDEVYELALVLTVDLTVELCKPVGVSLQRSECLCMSETNKNKAHTGLN